MKDERKLKILFIFPSFLFLFLSFTNGVEALGNCVAYCPSGTCSIDCEHLCGIACCECNPVCGNPVCSCQYCGYEPEGTVCNDCLPKCDEGKYCTSPPSTCTGDSFQCPPCSYSCVCNSGCGAEPECDGKIPGSRCGIVGICDTSCNCLEAYFEAWLGIEELSATLGQKFPVSVYIENKGGLIDSYELEVKTSSSNVEARIYDREILNVIPSSVVSTKVEIKILTSFFEEEEVKVTITSKTDPTKSKELSIIIKPGSSAMSELDNLSVVLLIAICCLIFIRKNSKLIFLTFN
ncbi:MAG: hypothetical protein QXQ77_01360 [Candidatus Aenigmatarchaeota archaeon]